MKLILLSITLIFNYVLGGEWLTLRGFYCIDKCKYHGDDYYAYWCHVTDDTKVIIIYFIENEIVILDLYFFVKSQHS